MNFDGNADSAAMGIMREQQRILADFGRALTLFFFSA